MVITALILNKKLACIFFHKIFDIIWDFYPINTKTSGNMDWLYNV